MNPFAFASLTFILTVSQAVTVAAKVGTPKPSTRTRKRISGGVIAGIVVAIVAVLIIAAIIIFLGRRSRRLKGMGVSAQPQEAPYINGGQAPGPEKGGYPPYNSTHPNAQPPAPHNPMKWGQDDPPPQFNGAPAFPAPHGPPYA